MQSLSAKCVISVGFLFLCLSAHAQSTENLKKADSRLNALYQQRVSQLKDDEKGIAALRAAERDWIKQRDHQCGKDIHCLQQMTVARADYLSTEVAQYDPDHTGIALPQELLGKWKINKILPANTISCWDDKQGRAIVGQVIEYDTSSLKWKGSNIKSLGVTTTMVKASDFQIENSGSGSSVSFSDLGIHAKQAKKVDIGHAEFSWEDGNPGGTTEIPGESVLIKNPETIVFSVCSTFFEAHRQ